MKKKLTGRSRILLAAAIGAVTVGTLVATAGVGFARDSVGAKQYQYGQKVTICHHTHSTKHPFVTIRVSPNAVKAHMKHGDTVGPCASSTNKNKGKEKGHKPGKKGEETPQPSTSPASPPGNGNGHGKPDDPGHGNGNGNGKGK